MDVLAAREVKPDVDLHARLIHLKDVGVGVMGLAGRMDRDPIELVCLALAVLGSVSCGLMGSSTHTCRVVD